MNIKIRAAVEMAKMMAVGATVAGTLTLLFEVVRPSPTDVIYALGFGALAFCFYNLYQITLSRLEYEEKLKETVDSFDK